jgi:hypothetical protein
MVAPRGVFPAILLTAVSQIGLHSAFAAESNAVITWNANAGVAAAKACMGPDGSDEPFHEGRMYAMMHIAIHDALNAIDRKYQPYAYDKKAESGTSTDAAIATAARDVLDNAIKALPAYMYKKECIDAGTAAVEAAYKAAIDAIPDSSAKKQGIALGQEAAAAILTKRANDNSDGQMINKDCPKQAEPGQYQCVPGFPFTVFEAWEKVTPFTLKDAAQFRPGPNYAITDAKFAAYLDEVKKLGGDGKTTPSARTPEQTEIARFWVQSSPFQWSRIARTVGAEKGLNTWESARLFAILDMVLADGYIAMASAKNHYNFWRPVTAIQAGGNKDWTPLVPTPPDQDYPSGHSIEGGAGAGVLKVFFGDQTTFKDCSITTPAGTRCGEPGQILRTYTSFSQAAEENAYSRVLVGFHFRNATKEGMAYGYKIAEQAVTLLPPVR